ncbi:hypothetical protein F4604DRAFT_1681452 [Suillus subluteus]|nr:hypothetical protein F4604DRAFT_1681452 [Suillus subluteus]
MIWTRLARSMRQKYPTCKAKSCEVLLTGNGTGIDNAVVYTELAQPAPVRCPGTPSQGGMMQRSPLRQPTRHHQMIQIWACLGAHGTAPPTPNTIDSSVTQSHAPNETPPVPPVLNPASQPQTNLSNLPPKFMSSDFVQSMLALEDLDSSMLRTDFEQDFPE